MDYKIQIAPNKVRQVLLLGVILLLGIMIYLQMTFMLGGFLGSVALYMIMRKPMYKMVYNKHWKRWASAMLLMLISFIIIILPFAWIASIFVQKVTPILKDPAIITATADKIEQYINRRFGVDILSQTNIQKITSTISAIIPKVLTSTLNVVANIVIMYFILWFMLTNSSKVELWLQRNLPFKPENRQKVLLEIKESVMSNTIGLPIMGIIQGGLAVLGYWIFGAQDPVLWGIVTGICSFIPFVGTMATWVPIAILTFANGDTVNGLGLTAWGLIVIGCADNIFRMVLQKKIGDIHPMITVFGVIVGLNMFGFLGLIFGPLLISMFLLLGKIYINEFVNPGEKVETITDTSGGERKDEHPPQVHL